jgi:hypothetical protein
MRNRTHSTANRDFPMSVGVRVDVAFTVAAFTVDALLS